MAQAVITEVGRRKLCRAHAGDDVLPKVTQMALGDGGLDDGGNVIGTTGNEVSLYHELLRREVDGHAYVGQGETTCRYTMRIGKEELAGEVISEMGLFDESGDLIAFKTFMGKGKDNDMEFAFDMDEIF